MVVVIFGFCASITISLKSYEKFQTRAVVVSIERDHYYWNTTLPSFTICPVFDRIDKNLFDNYCERNHIEGQSKQEFFEFMESMANATYENFHLIKDYQSVEVNYYDFIPNSVNINKKRLFLRNRMY